MGTLKTLIATGLSFALLIFSATAQAASVVDDSATTNLNTPVTINVVENDDGNWISGEFTQGANGSVVGASGGRVTYTPDNGFEGTDTFTYTLGEADGSFHTANVTVEVIDTPSTAYVTDDSASTEQGQSITVDVLANDSGNWVSSSWTQGANGSVAGTGGGLRYTPNGGFTGVDTFTYTLNEANGVPLTATVTVDVLEVVSTSYATDDFMNTGEDAFTRVYVLKNDSGAWVGSSWTQPANGTVDGAGSYLTYQPDLGFTGTDTFDYTLTEADGSLHTATATIEVLPAGRPTFKNISLSAGIDYRHHNLSVPAQPILMPLYMGAGAAAGDYDGDGDMDLFVTILDDNDRLYRNNGDTTFTDVGAAAGVDHGYGSNGAAWGDIDNDGDLDLYVTAVDDTRHYMYINDGSGVFTEEAVARGTSTEGPDSHYGQSVAFADYDNDGYLDMYVAEWRSDFYNPTGATTNSRLFRNLGVANPGYFEDVTIAAGVDISNVLGMSGSALDGTFSFTVRFSDLDNDGHLDLAIAADFGESRLFWNDGDGTFTDGTLEANVATDENGMGAAIGDVNGDGLLDWFVTSISGDRVPTHSGNRLYLNNGDRTFSDYTDTAGVREGFWGWGSTFVDYDNDGDEDLVMVNGFDTKAPSGIPDDGWEKDPMRFFENDGTGVFMEVSAAVGLIDAYSGKGVLKFDYDSDGDLDLFVTNNGGTVDGGLDRGRGALYRNDGGNNNSWLRIEATGNTPISGVRVFVTETAGASPQLREIMLGSNFLTQDESVAHFGLGAGTDPIHEVRVEWPDGTVQTMSDVVRNAVLVFEHP